jgi:hypothetical protein
MGVVGMTMFRIVRIDPVSARRTGFVMGVLFGAVIAALFMLFAFIFGWVTESFRFGFENLILGCFTGVFFAMLYILVSGLLAWVYALAYNRTAGYFGALQVELLDK